MIKKHLRLASIILFASFLMLALFEVETAPAQSSAPATSTAETAPAQSSARPNTAASASVSAQTSEKTAKNAELEVPITGSAKRQKTASTYESLAEIALLALVGTLFYLLNSTKIITKLRK
jgi:hypothetical protein